MPSELILHYLLNLITCDIVSNIIFFDIGQQWIDHLYNNPIHTIYNKYIYIVQLKLKMHAILKL